MDGPSVLLGELIKENLRSFPILFSLEIEQDRLRNAFGNSFTARIEKEGELKYISDRVNKVNTNGKTIISVIKIDQ